MTRVFTRRTMSDGAIHMEAHPVNCLSGCDSTKELATVADRANASVEFLGFLAYISCPSTGVIWLERVAAWLGLAANELESRWVSSGIKSWAEFAGDVLSVLDIMQDHTFDLAQTLAWCRHDALPGAGDTADERVSAGRVAQVRQALRNRKLV